jgi:hypothetical protein
MEFKFAGEFPVNPKLLAIKPQPNCWFTEYLVGWIETGHKIHFLNTHKKYESAQRIVRVTQTVFLTSAIHKSIFAGQTNDGYHLLEM